MNRSKSHTALRALCEGAVMLALAQALSYLKLWELPNGGSVTIAMLPVFLYCVRWGFGPGMLVSIAFGALQLIFDGGFAIGWQSMLGDYIVAFGVLGVAGLFWRMRGGFFWGAVVGCLARFLVHYVVGATIWASYMPDRFFGLTMTSPWFYSFLYNGSFMAIDLALVLVLGVLLRPTLGNWMKPVPEAKEA